MVKSKLQLSLQDRLHLCHSVLDQTAQKAVSHPRHLRLRRAPHRQAQGIARKETAVAQVQLPRRRTTRSLRFLMGRSKFQLATQMAEGQPHRSHNQQPALHHDLESHRFLMDKSKLPLAIQMVRYHKDLATEEAAVAIAMEEAALTIKEVAPHRSLLSSLLQVSQRQPRSLRSAMARFKLPQSSLGFL